MEIYIIKASGTMSEIIAALKTLSTIAGKGATLSDVATLKRFINYDRIVKNQFEKEV